MLTVNHGRALGVYEEDQLFDALEALKDEIQLPGITFYLGLENMNITIDSNDHKDLYVSIPRVALGLHYLSDLVLLESNEVQCALFFSDQQIRNARQNGEDIENSMPTNPKEQTKLVIRIPDEVIYVITRKVDGHKETTFFRSF